MKLIKQTILEYRAGASDKVYEVDLCEVGGQVGGGKYVVNYRYGRRGGNLREGSKTPLPVGLAEAERTFAKLVESRVKKGYRDQGDSAPAEDRQQPAARSSRRRTATPAYQPGRTLGPREQSILERLRLGPRAPRRAWNLDRAIWRAGELGIPEAGPLLIELWHGSKKGQLLRRYSIAWSLGRCASRGDSAAIEVLEAICDGDDADNTRRIAVEGLRGLYDGEQHTGFIDGQIDRLPRDLARLARSGPAETFTDALVAALDSDNRSKSNRKAALRALETCYLIDSEHVRPALLTVLAEKPPGKNYFVRMRHIFKAAEFRRDGEVFGLLAYRFEKTPSKAVGWYARRDTSEPFQNATRRYLRRRVWRTLRRLGQDQSPDFVKMAVGVLLPFTDDDGGEARTRRYYRWRKPDITIKWDQYSSFWAFNHLLHGSSTRYYPDDNGRAWRCRDSYQPGGATPKRREESFTALWDGVPAGLLHLLDESRCRRVHQFAAKALRANPVFDQLDASVAVMLLGRPYDDTVELGFELAQRIYDPIKPDIELLLAVAECRLASARDKARGWIDQKRLQLAQDTRFMAGLVASQHRENRELARNMLRVAVLTERAAQALIGRLVALIKSIDPDEGGDERIGDIAATLLACFGRRLANVGLQVIRDLIEHPAAAAQEFAGELLLNHSELARRTPDDLLLRLLDSPHEGPRAIGARLLAQLTDSALLEHQDLIVLLALHELPDLRSNIRPVIARLAVIDRRFAAAIVDQLTSALMHKQARGVHGDLLATLRDDLRDHLGHIDKATIWQLLHHKHPQAKELGGVLLATSLGPDDLSIAEIVKLASHEILAIRQGSWALCDKAIDRIKRAMPTAVRLLDAKWQDSRDFAFGFFRDKLAREDLPPAILIAICDSIRPDVQRFGRELITRYFSEEDGHTYLIRLSEHPGEALQLFATNYLEGYAAGQPERIRELEPYFVTVLSGINKGRIAKQRCIGFLRREALAHRDSAVVAARIFARQSATMAVGDRSRMIEAMVQIRRAHPTIEMPIAIHAPELRPGDARPGDVRPGEARSGV